MTVFQALQNNKITILYGVCLGALLLILSWLQLRFVILDHSVEIYAGAIAVIFTLLGIWIAIKFSKPKVETIVVEKLVQQNPSIVFSPNEKLIAELGLSKREMEVLQLMADGFSNQEISEKLFVSLNTVKTHGTRIFEKLEVHRRTQAVDKAKRLNIIP